jgi:predicted  nucleic acid-binding Zn-ribbon protein
MNRTNQVIFAVGAGVVSLCAGTLLTSNFKNAGQTITLATVLSLPTVAGLHLVLDGKATRRINEAQGKASNAESRASLAESKAVEAEATLSQAQSRLADLSKKNSELSSELASVRKVLEDVNLHRAQLLVYAEKVQPTITQLQQELKTASETAEALQSEIEDLETDFEEKVEAEAEERFQAAKREEIQRIFDEHDAITQKAMTLFKRLQSWGQKVAVSHEQKRELITSLASAYNQNLDELGQSVENERGHYLEQIELLHEKVGRLQHQLNGDLLEPEVNNAFGFAIEGRIANELASRLFSDLQIPLAVKGFYIKPDGSTDVGYGYSRSIPPEAVVEGLKRHSEHLARRLGIYKITSVRKLEISDLIVLTFRREAAIKDDTVKLIAGTPEQFLDYVASHPLRYRLIADPGQGKTPITAVMVSEILKVGGTRGNTGKGKKIPHTLVTVSCPDVESSQKDADYPLEVFLKYGNTTAAVKSFTDADEDWRYRKRDTNYAQNFFQLWVWDELDNTLNNADDPQGTGDKFKNFLKQAHHTGVGWIVSGQSVMTKQIPGFMDDDRELFTQIIIGTSKIRKYLEKYGKKILSAKVVNQLLSNLDDLEPYIEDKNSLVTDAARLLRLALVLDDKSPKLYFIPNLDSAKFDSEKIESVITQADQMKRQFLAKTSGKNGSELVSEAQNACVEGIGQRVSDPPFPTIGVSSHSNPSGQIPHCCHCGGSDLKLIENGKRYQCKGCTKRFVVSKAVWK